MKKIYSVFKDLIANWENESFSEFFLTIEPNGKSIKRYFHDSYHDTQEGAFLNLLNQGSPNFSIKGQITVRADDSGPDTKEVLYEIL